MPVKIATYNLNNLFERAKVMEETSEQGFSSITKEVLNDVAKLTSLLGKASYEGQTGEQIIELLTKYFITQPYKKANYFIINQIREKLYTVTNNKIKLKVNGKAEWMGFVEFTKVKTNSDAVINTARVLHAVDADIVCTVEVDNRIALTHFIELMHKNFNKRFKHAMLIDGNDERGIDIGLLSKHEITSICSHVDDEYTGADHRNYKIFSRDCAEYTVTIDSGRKVHILCNHFKSKGYGSQASSDEKRKKQADRVVELVSKFDLNKEFIVVAGDFNDIPGSAPLNGLLTFNGLKDVLNWEGFKGSRSTYHTGNQQIDYLLVSNALFNKISSVGIERRGIFKRGNVSFPEVTSKVTQASDHACVWASFDI